MGRNRADFESCPECYGRGYIGWVSTDKSEYSQESCPTCHDAREREANEIEHSFARAEQDMGK